ncbi:MAG: fatty acid desaturase, partial [Gemmatimonadetes bacterium]|nr:fatty acid desaturase [Pseudomonadales bacterium]NIS01274.1 fatty acid desaturase [Gemmatimonadota bacterium]NIW35382.1 fatty acid desaturase [Gemmatimonadota bacterium]NIX08583.1 fatty acid desaturase [Pseudomonadales bacterium]
YRLYRNPLALLLLGPAYQFLIKHRLPLDVPRSWKREWASVLGNDVVILAVLLAAWPTIGVDRLLSVHLP